MTVGNCFIPVKGKRDARKELQKDECNEPDDADDSNDSREKPKAVHGENSVIEIEDRQFDGQSTDGKDNCCSEEGLVWRGQVNTHLGVWLNAIR